VAAWNPTATGGIGPSPNDRGAAGIGPVAGWLFLSITVDGSFGTPWRPTVDRIRRQGWENPPLGADVGPKLF